RRKFAASTLAPRDRLVALAWDALHLLRDPDRLLVAVTPSRMWTPALAGASRRWLRIRPGRPDELGVRNADDVCQPSLREPIAKLGGLPVRSVSEHGPARDTDPERLIDQVERDLPLRPELHFVGNADRATSPTIVGPLLGQIQALPDHDAAKI